MAASVGVEAAKRCFLSAASGDRASVGRNAASMDGEVAGAAMEAKWMLLALADEQVEAEPSGSESTGEGNEATGGESPR